MNQKELNELRRRFRLDRGINHIYGCYVNSTKEIIAHIDTSLGIMGEEEGELYLKLLKKALSGALGKNLLDISFSTQQVVDSEEHRLLQTLRTTLLEDAQAREDLYQRIIQALDMGESNYLILLAADAYDVPHRGKDGEVHTDESDEVFRYFVCSICPVKDATLALRYDTGAKTFHSASSGQTVTAPDMGFLFPAFDHRTTNLYNALFYSRSTDTVPSEVIDALFHVEPPMSPLQQKNAFGTALGEALESECSYDVVQSVHEQVRTRVAEHKESRDPEPLELSLREVEQILENSGVPSEKVLAFHQECEKQYGENTALNPHNIVEHKKFEIQTPEIKISVAPEFSYLVETRVIDGRKFLLIPADEGVEVNGIGVTIASEAEN